MKRVYGFLGGRKMFMAMGGCSLLTAGALFVVWLGDPFPFGQWLQGVTALVLGMKFSTALEDSAKHKARGNLPHGGEEA